MLVSTGSLTFSIKTPIRHPTLLHPSSLSYQTPSFPNISTHPSSRYPDTRTYDRSAAATCRCVERTQYDDSATPAAFTEPSLGSLYEQRQAMSQAVSSATASASARCDDCQQICAVVHERYPLHMDEVVDFPHRSLSALQVSACNGCDLCRLLRATIVLETGRWNFIERSAHPCVDLEYRVRTSYTGMPMSCSIETSHQRKSIGHLTHEEGYQVGYSDESPNLSRVAGTHKIPMYAIDLCL